MERFCVSQDNTRTRVGRPWSFCMKDHIVGNILNKQTLKLYQLPDLVLIIRIAVFDRGARYRINFNSKNNLFSLKI